MQLFDQLEPSSQKVAELDWVAETGRAISETQRLMSQAQPKFNNPFSKCINLRLPDDKAMKVQL